MISLICELYMESKKSKHGIEPESRMGLPGMKGRGSFWGNHGDISQKVQKFLKSITQIYRNGIFAFSHLFQNGKMF